ncbi:MAG: formate dehydrogenase subunit alpha [Athalassotoga sp.]
MLSIEIDGRNYNIPEGKNLLEFLLENGFDIPHLCYHPALKSIGACRMCVVEVEGSKNLVTSCTAEIREGMKIKTNSPLVKESREVNLSLLLKDHPDDCMTCDQNGNCALQDLAYEYFPSGKPLFGYMKEKRYQIDDSSEFIVRDLNKCIKCQLCVRVCDEIEGMSIYSMVQRGHQSYPSTFMNLPLAQTNCVSCGECASVCPTGAIVEKPSIGKARWNKVEKVKTTCLYCGVGCQIDVYFDPKRNDIVRIQGSSENKEVNDAVATCVKGKFGYGFVNHPDRLKSPLLKKNGEFVPVEWDEAIDYTAKRLIEIKEKYGPDSIGFLSSARCTNEENYLLQKIARAVIGTNNIDHCARLCHASTVAGLSMTFGAGAMTNPMEDIENAEVIIVTGTNTTENHPVYGSRVKRAVRNGSRLIVIDPRKIDLVDYAELWLRNLPGTDLAILNGLLNVIIHENLIDEEFIHKRTEGFEEVKKVVEKYTPSYVAKIAGVDEKKLVKAAEMYAKAKTASILYAMGITQHVSGTKNVIAIANLAMATGKIGKPGSGVNPLRGQSNVQGAGDVGCLPNVFPGNQPVSNDSVREKFKKAWNIEYLSDKNGLTSVEMFDAILDGRIKALFVMGENPVMSHPDESHVRKALQKLEFMVDMDIFPNDTTKYAHVILAASSGFEKDGTFTNTERRVQRVRRVLNPVGNSKPDWMILRDLMNRLGYSASYNSPREIMEEISRVSPIYAGISYDRIDRKGIQWPCRSAEDEGTPILHQNSFSTENGLGKFISVEYKEPPEIPDEEYPFYLSTGRILYQYHTGTMTRRVKEINDIRPKVEIEINPDDAKNLGIKNGEIIRVTSRRGSIEGPAKITERSQKGLVFIPFHYAESPANMLTLAAIDPIAKIPTFKVSAVKIEKVKVEDHVVN